MADLHRRHHPHPQFGGHRLGHRFAAVQFQQHPRIDPGLGASLIEGAPGNRTRFAQHHDHLIQFLELHAFSLLRPRMPVGHQRANPRFVQRLQMQALARLDLGQHRHVGMFGQQRRQGFLGVAQAQVHRDPRIARPQAGEHRHDHVRAVRRHLQTPGQQLPVGFEHRLRLLGQAEHRPGDRRQLGALLRQFHASGGAAQQGDLVVLFQRLDVPGDRRLADEQPRRRPGKTAFPGHGIEGAELKQVHE
ncbi:hypothetical protein D3C75_569050 [compost metagenome]